MKLLPPAILLAALSLLTPPLWAQGSVLSGPGYINLSETNWSPDGPLVGKKFVWWPNRSSLRIGAFDEGFGDLDWMGYNTFAGGENALAEGYASFAYGSFVEAAGDCSIAFGSNSAAYGQYSVAIGLSASAGGDRSLAFGLNASADGSQSIALGGICHFMGPRAFSLLGGETYAEQAIALMGRAYAARSLALGSSTQVFAIGGVALGSYNLAKDKNGKMPNNTSSSPDDPIFEVGNGNAYKAANALTIYRDGTIRITKPQGGIAMGQFQ